MTSTRKKTVSKKPMTRTAKRSVAEKPAPRLARKSVAKKAAAKSPGRKAAVPAGEVPIVSFARPDEWSTWLATNHASSRGVWLKLAKKASGIPSPTYAEALDVALSWGWIDAVKNAYDDVSWIQKFAPRGPRSTWSKINREKALALIAAKKMQPAGLEQVERAQKDGRWDAAYDSQSRATVPEDLAVALAANPRAATFFATLNSVNRYAVLFRIHNVKKAETRARKIATFVEMLARGEMLHPA